MVNGKKIFCVIPAYNEEKNISHVVMKAKEYADEVIVVDDGSHDKTSLLAMEAGALVLRHIINRGQGAGLETGNRYAYRAGADIVVHFDADDQFVASEIGDIVSPLAFADAQVVFGSRFLTRKSNMPWIKKNIFMPLGRLVNRVMVGAVLTDPQCGFRALSRDALGIISIQHDGMAHCSEIINKTFRNGLKAEEVPITVIYHDFGQRFFGGVKIVQDLIIGLFIN